MCWLLAWGLRPTPSNLRSGLGEGTWSPLPALTPLRPQPPLVLLPSSFAPFLS